MNDYSFCKDKTTIPNRSKPHPGIWVNDEWESKVREKAASWLLKKKKKGNTLNYFFMYHDG